MRSHVNHGTVYGLVRGRVSLSGWALTNHTAKYLSINDSREMANSESQPLIKTQWGHAGDSSAKVQFCCVKSSRLARVPVLRTLCRRKRPEDEVNKSMFACMLNELLDTYNNTHTVFHTLCA